METKKWYESKTMWLNIAAGILAVLVLVDKNLLTVFGLSEEAQAKVLTAIGTIVAIVNILLRAGVQQPVSTLPSGTVVGSDVKVAIDVKKAQLNRS